MQKVILAALGCVLVSAGLAAAADELRGVYMELHTNRNFGTLPIVPDGDWRGLMRRLKAQGANAVFPCAVSASGACYPSKVVPTWPAARMQNKPDLLKAIIDAAHAEGIEVHPWTIEWYKSGRAPADRLVHDAAGKTHKSLCPSVEANRKLMREMILELVRNYDVDGVHYDYMRFPSSKFCYCRHCRAGFEKAIRRRVADWPADVVKGGRLEKPYYDYLSGTLDSFVREMYPLVKKTRPKVVVSAAVWCNSSSAQNTGVRQNWGKWAAGGWCDFIAPMNYGSKWIIQHFGEFAANEAKQLSGKVPCVYGLGAYQDSAAGTVKSVATGRGLECSGFIVYTLTEKIFREHMSALGRGPWSRPARVPAFGRR